MSADARKVVLVEYDTQWPIRFREEAERIRGAIGRAVVSIEHIGSTAVSGLVAKPILDILVGVRRLEDSAECVGPLGGIGYEYVPEHEALFPERRYFHKGPPGRRTHHMHLVEYGGGFWTEHVLFRDYLRTHPDEATRYASLKRELAALVGHDPHLYTDGKTAFIRHAVAKARKGIS